MKNEFVSSMTFDIPSRIEEIVSLPTKGGNSIAYFSIPHILKLNGNKSSLNEWL